MYTLFTYLGLGVEENVTILRSYCVHSDLGSASKTLGKLIIALPGRKKVSLHMRLGDGVEDAGTCEVPPSFYLGAHPKIS